MGQTGSGRADDGRREDIGMSPDQLMKNLVTQQRLFDERQAAFAIADRVSRNTFRYWVVGSRDNVCIMAKLSLIQSYCTSIVSIVPTT